MALMITACTSTTAYRHKGGSITVSQRGFRAEPTNYWISGATPGQIAEAGKLNIYRRTKGANRTKAVPLRCSGFVDTTRDAKIEIRIAEKSSGQMQQAWVNGTHKLVDERKPKPFYHWLIP